MIKDCKLQPILKIDQLSFAYGRQPVIDQVSLSVSEGEIFTLIGPNGCGKSTLLRLSNGLIDQKYEKKKISIYDRTLDAFDRKELARTIAVLPQSRNVPDITVGRLVEHGRFPYLDLSRHLTGKDQDKITDAINIMQLQALKDKNLTGLSGGERQRAYIAMALAQDTPLLFLDEPTTYLDINYQFELMDTIRLLNQTCHKTILMVLHDLNLALQYSDRIGVMEQGHLLFTGTPAELIRTDILKQVFHVTCSEVIIDGTPEYVIHRHN